MVQAIAQQQWWLVDRREERCPLACREISDRPLDHQALCVERRQPAIEHEVLLASDAPQRRHPQLDGHSRKVQSRRLRSAPAEARPACKEVCHPQLLLLPANGPVLLLRLVRL